MNDSQEKNTATINKLKKRVAYLHDPLRLSLIELDEMLLECLKMSRQTLSILSTPPTHEFMKDVSTTIFKLRQNLYHRKRRGQTKETLDIYTKVNSKYDTKRKRSRSE